MEADQGKQDGRKAPHSLPVQRGSSQGVRGGLDRGGQERNVPHQAFSQQASGTVSFELLHLSLFIFCTHVVYFVSNVTCYTKRVIWFGMCCFINILLSSLFGYNFLLAILYFLLEQSEH